MRLSNELVYNGALKCGNDKVADGQLSTTSDDTSPGWIQTVLCSDKRVLFLDMDKVITTFIISNRRLFFIFINFPS